MPPPFAALLLDMDGVLYRGDAPLPHAARFCRAIARWPHAFLTNNPTRTPAAVRAHLRALGLTPAPRAAVVTSAVATADWLARQRPGFRYFAVGGEGLHRALAARGRPDAAAADFVVVGEGPGLDYDSLTTGINLILRGARLVATNPDANLDGTRHGRPVVLPGGGALVAPFAVASGVRPVVIGKPEPHLYEIALHQLGVAAREAVMVGDRPDTDILGAQRLGMRTALVRTGRFPPGAPLPDGVAPPDWDVPDLAALLAAWGLGAVA